MEAQGFAPPSLLGSQVLLYTERTGLASAGGEGSRPLSGRPSWQHEGHCPCGARSQAPFERSRGESAPFASVGDFEPLWNDLKHGWVLSPQPAIPSFSGAADWGPTDLCFLWPTQVPQF